MYLISQFRKLAFRLGVILALVVPGLAAAQDITGGWQLKGFNFEADANPAGFLLDEMSLTMTVTSLGGGNYRLSFAGADGATAGEFETSLTQSGNVFSGAIITEVDGGEQVRRRTLIRVINSTTLLLNHVNAGFSLPTDPVPNTQWWYGGALFVATRTAMTHTASGTLWAGNFSLGESLMNGVVSGTGFAGETTDSGVNAIGVASGGGYRYSAGTEGDGTFVTPSGQHLSRDVTPPNRQISGTAISRTDSVSRRDSTRILQMANGDLVLFTYEGEVAQVTGRGANTGMQPLTYTHFGLAEVAYAVRQGSSVTIASSPASRSVNAGGATTFTATINQPAGSTPTFQWYRDGTAINGQTGTSLSLPNVQPADAGSYSLGVTAFDVTQFTPAAVLGVSSSAKAAGNAYELAANIQHPNGNFYDQVLLNGAAGTVTANSGQVTRTSYIDLSDDIVQVEFSGAGALSITLAGASGPATPVKYNQSNVSYMKGHATITITGADETTNVSIFSVGRLTAFDPTGAYDMTKPLSQTNNPANTGSPLFRASETYDGRADVALLNIISSNGKFGGVRAANASFWATSGNTGVFAPGVQFTGPVFVHDVNAQDGATPVLITGTIDTTGEIRIAGGDLLQSNDRAVKIGGATKITMVGGLNSHATSLAANNNLAVVERDDAVVTAAVVTNP